VLDGRARVNSVVPAQGDPIVSRQAIRKPSFGTAIAAIDRFVQLTVVESFVSGMYRFQIADCRGLEDLHP
jgi:hypothetical protein